LGLGTYCSYCPGAVALSIDRKERQNIVRLVSLKIIGDLSSNVLRLTKTPSTPVEEWGFTSIDNQGKDNCGALASTAATTTTMVKGTATAAVTTNKEKWR
jgi:hypothetical protein